jgi:putative peptidoglycan lipid II flippase
MLSRILGYIRDAISAALFGVGMVSDAFFVAFRIPNLLRDLMAEGALSSAFIPVFTDYKENKKEEELWRMANNVLTVLTILLVFIVIIGIIAAPLIVTVIAPGFSRIPDKFHLTVELTRVLFPFIMLVSLAAIFMGMLNSFKNFSAPAFAPVMFNVGIILFGLLVCPHFNETAQIYVWAAGSIFGAILQLGIQLIPAYRHGYRPKVVIDLKDKGLRRMGKLMVPATLGQSITQISLIINTIIASFLAAGSVTYLYYGNRLMQLPLGVFGVAIATVSFPYISSYAARGEMQNLKDTIRSSVKQALFIVLPATAGIIFLSRQINMLLFFYGKFSYQDVINTANVSIMYSIGIFAYSGVKILTPVFYALDKANEAVKTGMIALVITLALNIIFVLVLPNNIAFLGLALGTTIGGCFNFFTLYAKISKQIGDIGTKEVLVFASKIFVASLVMGAVVIAIAFFMERHMGSLQLTRKQNGLIVAAAITAGIGVYFFMIWVMRIEEGKKLMSMIGGKFRNKNKEIRA